MDYYLGSYSNGFSIHGGAGRVPDDYSNGFFIVPEVPVLDDYSNGFSIAGAVQLK